MTHRMDRQEILREELRALKREHRQLDDDITAAQTSPSPDQIAISRMKKQKLALKDAIQRIEDEITPDIIA